jgi:hypothetical protein
MNNYNIINFILLTIILALIIHIVLKNMYSKKNNQNKTQQIINTSETFPFKVSIVSNKIDDTLPFKVSMVSNKVDDTQTDTSKINELSIKTPILDNNNNEESPKYQYPTENTDFELLVGNTTWNNHFDNGIISSEDKHTDDFFNEYVFNGRNRVSSSNLSDKEKDNYRNNYFNFRDNTWTMPNHDNDGVDAVNDMRLAEVEGQMNLYQNNTIKDIYDSLTSRKDNFFFKSQINTENFNEEATQNLFNSETQLNSFYDKIGTGGQCNTADIFTYENDYVSNGNEYFNGVYANDKQSNESPMNL